MKPINFLKTISVQEQRAIAIWYRASVLLLAITIICMASIQMYQVQRLRTIKQQKKIALSQNSYNPAAIEQLKSLTEQEKKLQEKQDFIAQLTTQRGQLLDLLKTMQRLLAQEWSLRSCSISAAQLSLSLVCPSAHAAYAYRDALAGHASIESLKITSLQPHQDKQQTRLLATLSGTLKVN